MKRLWIVLCRLGISLLAVGGNAGVVALALARHTQLVTALIAALLVLAGVVQSHIAWQRAGRRDLRPIHGRLRTERGVGRLCTLIAAAIVVASCLLPPLPLAGFSLAASALASWRIYLVVTENAIEEGKLRIPTSSPAQECSWIARNTRRIAALFGSGAGCLKDAARTAPASGETGALRRMPVLAAITTTIAYLLIGSALAGERILEASADSAAGVTSEPRAPRFSASGRRDLGKSDAEDEPTYAELCPELPDPLAVGHGIGALFRHDSAFSAGCGQPALRIEATGAWYAIGVCADELRSLGVAGPDGGAVLLYGAGARFAWAAAESGELVSAEVRHPEGGDVYAVETLTGTYGFARTAAAGGRGPDRLRSCTDVTATDRPFAELPPPMMLLWRVLVSEQEAWLWPRPSGMTKWSFAFSAAAGDTPVAEGACAADFACYLDADNRRRPVDGTAYVSLREFAPFMPPAAS